MILIAGPCVIESKKTLRDVAEQILESIEGKKIDFYFKSSFEKANRTKIESFSGLDTEEALGYLREIKKEYRVNICTDFHTIDQLSLAHKYDVDVIQIPAFLAKQTRLISEASNFAKKYGKKLFIKKPQFVGPNGANQIIDNAKLNGLQDVWIGDRGTQMGYDQYFMDPRHVPIMKNNAKVLGDITHPNKNYPGKLSENIKTLGMSYLAAGADGLFIETHTNCNEALCDRETMLSTEYLIDFMEKFYNIYRSIR